MADGTSGTKGRGRGRRVWMIALVAVLIAGAYGIGSSLPVLVRPPLVLGQDAVTDTQSATVTVTLEDIGGQVIHIAPPGERKVVFNWASTVRT